MRIRARGKVESGGSRRIGDILARGVREESVNNLACFFVVRTAWAGGWSQSPQCLAWKVLSLERDCSAQPPGNRSTRVQDSSWERSHSRPFRYNVIKIVMFWFSLFNKLSFVFLMPCVWSLRWCLELPRECPSPLCLSVENVSENIQRDMSAVSVLSPTPKKVPFEEVQRHASIFC